MADQNYDSSVLGANNSTDSFECSVLMLAVTVDIHDLGVRAIRFNEFSAHCSVLLGFLRLRIILHSQFYGASCVGLKARQHHDPPRTVFGWEECPFTVLAPSFIGFGR
jgi:hypothetical protein